MSKRWKLLERKEKINIKSLKKDIKPLKNIEK